MKNLLLNNFASLKTSHLSKLTSVYMYVNGASLNLLKIFEKEGLIRGFKYVDTTKGLLCVYLKYMPTGNSVIKDLLCVSTTKRRLYLKSKQLSKINDTLNLYFISNKKGDYILNQASVKQLGLGGEVKYIVKVNNLNHNLRELLKK
uniref:Ribosomal protein S8 n=1 Tax=Heterostelium pallidum TaxID=13642 RepID=B2XX53_HETPA|nr:ribosomal protein S8 [Heterostelium pallidum]